MTRPNTQPRVSVLLPVYNGERYLRRTLDSLLRQTFRSFEVIAVNDASPDSSRAIVLSYRDPRIHLIDNTHNLGQTASLQIALENARGEYVARQDQDDISLPERFRTQVTFLDEHPEVGVVGTGYTIIDEMDRFLDEGVASLPTETMAEIAWRFVWSDEFVDSSVMFRRADALRLGGYDVEYRYAQDFELWVRLSSDVGMARLQEALLQLRIHRNSASMRCGGAQETEVYRIIQSAVNKVMPAPISLETASTIRRVLSMGKSASFEDVRRVKNVILRSIEPFAEKRKLQENDLASVRLAAAEMIMKIAARHSSTSGLRTMALMADVLRLCPSLPLRPALLASWWQKHRRGKTYRKLMESASLA